MYIIYWKENIILKTLVIWIPLKKKRSISFIKKTLLDI